MEHLRRPFWFMAGFAVMVGGVALRITGEQPFGNFQAQVSALEFTDSYTLPPKPHTLLFVGDIMLSRGVANVMEREGDVFYPFRLVADEIRSADFAFGNLENPISNRGKNQGSIYSFRADPQVVHALAFAGFDALSVANNHIWDWGREALEDTIELLTINNIQGVGAGMNYADANEPKFFTLPGGTTLALFAYTNLLPRSLEATETTSGLSHFDIDLIADRIRALSTTAVLKHSGGEANVIIVSLHWGEEYSPTPSVDEREIAHALVDAGADLVIGHHPHVVQEVAAYKVGARSDSDTRREPRPAEAGRERTAYVAYSLGNFIFDQNFSRTTTEGLMLKVFVDDKQISSVQKIPLKINETFQPYAIGS